MHFACMYVYVVKAFRTNSVQNTPGARELKLQVDVNHARWLPRTEPWFPAKAASALNRWTTYPAHVLALFLFLIISFP